jgi:hypothetical protein
MAWFPAVVAVTFAALVGATADLRPFAAIAAAGRFRFALGLPFLLEHCTKTPASLKNLKLL